jgi:hypothetical protein
MYGSEAQDKRTPRHSGGPLSPTADCTVDKDCGVMDLYHPHSSFLPICLPILLPPNLSPRFHPQEFISRLRAVGT